MLEQGVGETGCARQHAGVGGGFDFDGNRIERIDRAEIERVGARRTDALVDPPSASSTVRREPPKPDCVRSFANAAGPWPSEVKARMRVPGCKCGRTRSSERPCTEMSAVCGSDQPSRAAARLKADGAGITVISLASMRRASAEPTP